MVSKLSPLEVGRSLTPNREKEDGQSPRKTSKIHQKSLRQRQSGRDSDIDITKYNFSRIMTRVASPVGNLSPGHLASFSKASVPFDNRDNVVTLCRARERVRQHDR